MLFDLRGIANGWVTGVAVRIGLLPGISGKSNRNPCIYFGRSEGYEDQRGIEVAICMLCEAGARWEVKALMAAVELQRAVEGTASATVRSTGDETENRLKDMMKSQPSTNSGGSLDSQWRE